MVQPYTKRIPVKSLRDDLEAISFDKDGKMRIFFSDGQMRVYTYGLEEED